MSKPPADLIIRPPVIEDACRLHVIRTLPGVMRGTMQIPSMTVEQVRRQMETSLMDPAFHAFVAELHGEIVGMAGLHVGSRRRSRVGDLGISVHDLYTGQGIGRALMQRLLDVADNYLGLKRLELEVITDNEPAIHLYESLGFVREGVKRSSMFRGGVFVDTIILGRVRDD
ncbi:MAG: GNAT family N-acetyltransferase [Chloroflexota bacterium]|nr:GNAT family N-acetyltransferase [Chloroflexota bacterium]